MSTAATAKTASLPASEPSVGYARYVVFVLMVCYTLSFIDRQILSLLVGSIKRDLAISDTRIGLLQGLAFGLFYTFLGLPLGRLADTLLGTPFPPLLVCSNRPVCWLEKLRHAGLKSLLGVYADHHTTWPLRLAR